MSTETLIEELRQEIVALRREIAELRGERVVHHYHHQAAPAPFIQAPTPLYPGGPIPTTCGGSAVGVGFSDAWAWNGGVA